MAPEPSRRNGPRHPPRMGRAAGTRSPSTPADVLARGVEPLGLQADWSVGHGILRERDRILDRQRDRRVIGAAQAIERAQLDKPLEELAPLPLRHRVSDLSSPTSLLSPLMTRSSW